MVCIIFFIEKYDYGARVSEKNRKFASEYKNQLKTSSMKRLLSTICSVVLMTFAKAQTSEGLILHYNFNNVDGTTVTDLSPTQANAELKNGAKIVTIGKYSAVDLGSANGYVDMNATKKAGVALKALADHTISCCYLIYDSQDITAAGNFMWSFSTLTSTSQTAGSYAAYRVNVQRIAASHAGWDQEVGFEVGSASAKGQWIHVLYRQTGSKGELFLNGRKVASADNMPVMSETFTTTPQYCFIGRPAFSSDSYLKNTIVTDFRVYDKSLDNNEIAKLASVRKDIENEYKYGTPGDFTALKAKVEEIKAFTDNAAGEYAVNAIAELTDELNLATNEIRQGKISQLFVDSRLKTLQAVYNKCMKTNGFTMPEIPVFNQADHGFRHPGGIHSQEDFDRIKQLLAEGDPTITAAWNLLCSNEYSQSTVETWPTWEIWRSGSGDNYMNVARGAAMAYQNALRWKIAGTEANAKNGVRILMKWARENDHVSGNTNMSLAFGLYGYALAQAAELLRDYPGWSAEDFNEFKDYIKRVWYPGTIDFLRRRHDTWANPGNIHGERAGHYWSNWGLCCALATVSYGVLLDDVHIYNQGMSFFKYDHVGTWQDSNNRKTTIPNWGCNEYLGNLVVCLHDDVRGPFGKLGQMQESGRDQGHVNMALGLALDICQMGLTQGDDLFAYMNDRMAAGIEWMAAYNFGNVNDLPWTPYNYADRGGYLYAGWQQDAPNAGSRGQWRPIWWRALGYYEGVRGITPKYTRMAAETVGIDGGGSNYGQNSGGFDHLGFSVLTSYRKKIAPEDAPLILTGQIQYQGKTLNQTDLGGLKYTHVLDGSHAIANDGAEITLMPLLPEGVADNGSWRWETGETTRNITVKADHSYIYRVHYICDNGADAVRAFSIAVAGDCEADFIRPEITVDGVITTDTVVNVFYGESVILYVGNSSGYTNSYRWDNGYTGGSIITIPNITTSRIYTCQYMNQGGHISEIRFHINVDKVRQFIEVNGIEKQSNETSLLKHTEVVCRLQIPETDNPEDVVWHDGSKGCTFTVESLENNMNAVATYEGDDNVFTLNVKTGDYSYFDILSLDNGYSIITSKEEIASIADSHYFVMASDDADLLIGLKNASHNGNKALFFQSPVNPVTDLSKLFTVEPYNGGICLRNVDYDGLLLQTEMNRADQLRTHDQPVPCEWALLLNNYDGNAWTIENGKYMGNWLGLWTPSHGYIDGEEIACNKKGDDIAHLQFFAISKERFHRDFLSATDGTVDATPLIVNPDFTGNGIGWNISGTWGNQRYNGAVEVWHSTNFAYTQSLAGLPNGKYTISCQLVNGEGSNTGYLFATSSGNMEKAVVSASCKGSNFDAERDKMTANANFAKLSVEVEVTDGTLQFGIKEPSSGTTWLVWDNFRITYNAESTGVESIYSVEKNSNAIYNLAGQRIADIPLHGFYIKNGKKVLK